MASIRRHSDFARNAPTIVLALETVAYWARIKETGSLPLRFELRDDYDTFSSHPTIIDAVAEIPEYDLTLPTIVLIGQDGEDLGGIRFDLSADRPEYIVQDYAFVGDLGKHLEDFLDRMGRPVDALTFLLTARTA